MFIHGLQEEFLKIGHGMVHFQSIYLTYYEKYCNIYYLSFALFAYLCMKIIKLFLILTYHPDAVHLLPDEARHPSAFILLLVQNLQPRYVSAPSRRQIVSFYAGVFRGIEKGGGLSFLKCFDNSGKF